jgi:hypothetical protein
VWLAPVIVYVGRVDAGVERAIAHFETGDVRHDSEMRMNLSLLRHLVVGRWRKISANFTTSTLRHFEQIFLPCLCVYFTVFIDYALLTLLVLVVFEALDVCHKLCLSYRCVDQSINQSINPSINRPG